MSNLLGKPRDSTSILNALPGKLDIKRYKPCILYLSKLCVVVHTDYILSTQVNSFEV